MLKQITSRILARQAKGYNYILTSSDKWRLQALMETGSLRDDLAKEIAAATQLQQKEILRAFEDAGVKALDYDDKVYQRAGLSPKALKESPYLIRLMQRNYEATMQEWSNYTRTTADASEQYFIETMDQVYTDVMSGGVGYVDAYVKGINNLASHGLTVRYPSGHVDTIETAALRCVRTGVSQASAQIQTARMDEMGVDLVLVSSHMGARPSHQIWQGKVYSRSGSSEKYADFASSTGYGTGPGLCGWNCRHSFGPYFEGQGNPFLRYNNKENKELYERTQDQRAMERGIRKSKREREVLADAVEKAPDEETKAKLRESLGKVQKRLTGQNKAYREYCDKYDLRPLPERLKIAKTGGISNNIPEVPKPEVITPKPEVIIPAQTFETKMGSIRDRVKQNGKATEEDIKEAGRLLRDEVQKTPAGDPSYDVEAAREQLRGLIDRRSDLQLEVQEYTDQIEDIIMEHVPDPDDIFGRLSVQDVRIEELQNKIDAILRGKEWEDLVDKIDALKMEISTAQGDNMTAKADRLRSVLSRFRKMGHKNVANGVKSRTEMGNVLRKTLDYYPEEWIQKAIDSGGITVKKVQRGYCNSFTNVIGLSGYGEEHTFATAVHELGHYFERKVSVSDTYVPFDKTKTWWKPYLEKNYPEGGTYILDAERAFYKRRTKGEELEWLGTGYKRDEKTRKDNFIHPYMGKDYDGYDFELVSMGFQYAYTEPERLAADPDMEEWIYGLLSLF